MDSGIVEPFFSIICPCYNQGHFLREAVQSVLNQDFLDWELIIIDDGSTDSTFEVANLYAQSDSRIKLIRQENRGLSAARNAGLELASGEWVHLLDADDIVLNNSYKVVQKAVQNSQADVLVGGYSYFDKTGYIHTHFFVDEFLDTQRILRANIAPPVAFFFRKELIANIGNFDPALKSCEDWDFWIRAVKLGAKIQTISEVIVGYRYVSLSMSRNPIIMYQTLSEVSQRAFQKDSKLPKTAILNIDLKVDLASIQKQHLIRCLGVMIHQGKSKEAARWFKEEKKNWSWEISLEDWLGLSSSLSWRYLLEHNQIKEVLEEVKIDLHVFFTELGYSSRETHHLIFDILRSQRYRMNHYRYGKCLGSTINRIFK